MAYQGHYALGISIFAGTVAGLVIKYLLDKQFIFCFHTQNALHNAQTFLIYTSMGLVTTAIFWGFEFGFHLWFGSKEMRYLGAVVGLGLGYWAKYHLDKHYVFRQALA